MVSRYGMSEAGFLNVSDEAMLHGGEVAMMVHRVADQLLRDAHRDAYALLSAHQAQLRAVAEKLLDEENLTLAQVRATIAELPRTEPLFCAQVRHDAKP